MMLRLPMTLLRMSLLFTMQPALTSAPLTRECIIWLAGMVSGNLGTGQRVRGWAGVCVYVCVGLSK